MLPTARLLQARAYGGFKSPRDPQRPRCVLSQQKKSDVEDWNIFRSRSASSFGNVTALLKEVTARGNTYFKYKTEVHGKVTCSCNDILIDVFIWNIQ